MKNSRSFQQNNNNFLGGHLKIFSKKSQTRSEEDLKIFHIQHTHERDESEERNFNIKIPWKVKVFPTKKNIK